MMPSLPLGTSSLVSSRLAYGCWRLAGDVTKLNAEAEKHGRDAVIAAFEAGYTLFDNADIYGRTHAERIFGDALHSVPGMREKILIATKCGVRYANEPEGSPQRWDFSASHILQSCEQSLKRLRIETIDLYQLHRPDFLANPVEIAAAFSQLHQSGKVRFFGVSNFRPSLVAALQAACPLPVVSNQVEISLARMDAFTDGTLDQCLERKMTPLAWSPLARGLLGDGSSSPQKAQPVADRIAPVLDVIARARNVSRTTVALAWLLKHPAGIIPIVGSTNPGRIRDAISATRLELTRDEWYRLLLAARGEPLP